jgi:hypothetical protein
MSTLALAPCTLIFTGADLASVHEQITKYYTEKALAVPVPEPAPVPVAPALFPYEKGLVKEDNTPRCWPSLSTFNTYCALREYGNSKPAEIAKVARELAAKHFPEHEALAGEYIYLRYLLGTCGDMWRFGNNLDKELRKIDSTLQLNEFLTFSDEGHLGGIMCLSMTEFKRLLHQAAAKLVKAGWESHRNGNFAGTEFQKAAIICSKHKIDGVDAGYSLDANALDQALAKL